MLLRRLVRKRPPQHSCKTNGTASALKNRHLLSAWSFGFEIGPRFRYNGSFRDGKWDIPADTHLLDEGKRCEWDKHHAIFNLRGQHVRDRI